ncbi:MAG TPA: EpsD family peptidyl-prolyl cis-trans isomerase [Usitatibacter sp.]|nr:EpsD family peptidyl-prolyl cis-trans isomerase [Usitatibacter sp.]
MNRSAMLRAAAVAAAVAAAACSRDEAGTARDVAARVNGGEVPLGRVESALARDAARGAKDAASRALESAIDEELLVQKALAARVDRDPGVVRALDESRRRILARAWLDKAIGDRARPDAREVRRFYAVNPALFGARRIYALRELRVAGGAARAADLRAMAARHDAAAVEAWLAREGLRFEARESTRAAEAVPLALLVKLQSMKDGEIAVVDGGSAQELAVVELRRSIAAPLTEAEAAPMIGRFLASRERVRLAREEIARLRSESRIEYVGARAAAPRSQRPRPASAAIAVNASLEATYDPPMDPQVAASAAPGKDETS